MLTMEYLIRWFSDCRLNLLSSSTLQSSIFYQMDVLVQYKKSEGRDVYMYINIQ